MLFMRALLCSLFWGLPFLALAQAPAPAWMPDLGDGTYQNPVLYADYSDPDICRVGEDYYLTASSFICQPGLPILHSRDLVNWTLIGHAIDHLAPREVYDLPDHGNGVWAPAIRHHDGSFYIYYGDPNYGIFMLSASDPAGPWTVPHLVRAGKGWIDPCPFWDDDGQAYLVHAWAGSRAGFKSVLMMHRMCADGKSLLGQPALIFDGHEAHPTVEGPKMYKHEGYYYILAPAGGVSTGWQLALRAQHPFGPYEERVVMAQGSSDVNGPHQGGWVRSAMDEDWFLHFQDRGAYGRIVHLQPMSWRDGWPMIGEDLDGDGIGEPVLRHRKPATWQAEVPQAPASSDEFNTHEWGLQWQWMGNPQVKWGYPSGNLGFLRLNAIPLADSAANLWEVPHLLLQKFPAESFTVTTKLDFHSKADGEEVGLVIMGEDYATLSIRQVNGALQLSQATCLRADRGTKETLMASADIPAQTHYLRVTVTPGGIARFSYSSDGREFQSLGSDFEAKPGRWIGAKVGLFCTRRGITNDAGYADIDWFRVE